MLLLRGLGCAPPGPPSSASVASSAAVRVLLAAIDRRLPWLTLGTRSLGIAPIVILEMLYVENRLDARRSSASDCFSAAREDATPGLDVASGRASGAGDMLSCLSGGGRSLVDDEGGVDIDVEAFGSGDASSITTEGGDTGLSTRE